MRVLVLAVLLGATPQMRASVNRAFRPDEFEVLLTTNLSEAFEASVGHRPGVLLLDLNRPLYQGWRIMEGLKAINPGAPVVVLSDQESIYDSAVAHREGVVLTKPVDGPKLAGAVNSLLEAQSARKGKPDPGDPAKTGEVEAPHGLWVQPAWLGSISPTPYRDWGINE